MFSSTLLKTSWRYLLRHPWQLALTILGVALGVAVVVAIDLANDSARRAFTLSTEAVAGRATHQIVGGPTGLDEAVYRQVRVDLGVRRSAPVLDGYALAADQPGLTLRIFGIDPLAEAPFRPFLAPSNATGGAFTQILTEPNGALLAATTANAYGLAVGDSLRLQIGTKIETATIIGLLEPEDESSRRALDGLLVADLSTAQEWLGMVGRLSQIDLVFDEDATGEAELARVQAALPEGTRLIRPESRTATLQQLTAAFELNLSALSLLALVVGMFLIYNTMTFSVVQRRSLIGTLRCLGVARRQIFGLVLGEALLVGLVGALLGLGLGVLLGRGLVTLVTQTINDLYFAVSVREVIISPLPLLKGLALGIGATLLAALAPAIEATSTPPRTVLRRSSYEEKVRKVVPLVAGGGLVLLIGGLGVLLLPTNNLALSFSGLFGMTIGAAALTPLVTLGLMRLAHPVLGRMFGLLGRMAARDVTASLSRTSVAIAALMIAVSVTIGVGLMVSSFRQTVVQWLGQTLIADVYVSPPSRAANQIDTLIPAPLIERFEQTPGVATVRQYRASTVGSPNGDTLLVASNLEPARDGTAYQFLSNNREEALQRFTQGEILISEPLAFRRGLAVGDQLTLYTDQGERSFRVAGIYYDYGADRGVALIDLALYRQLWDDQGTSSLGIYAQPGQDVDQLVERMRASVAELAGGSALFIRSNAALRTTSLEIFDRTFAITGVLQLLATIVAFVGILAALMALQLERARELGILRANGLTPGQLWGAIITQTGLMGFTAGLLALPVGVMLAAVLIFVINKRSFGWTLLFQIDPALFGQAMLVAVIAALLAGIYPAWRMARTSPALALREE